MVTSRSNIVYGTCVGSWEKFQANVARPERQIIALSGQTDIAVAYNSILEYCVRREVDLLVLQHDDLEITDPDAEQKFLDVVAELGVALVGVAGGSGQHGLGWWGHSPIGHQLTDAMMIDFGARSGDVDLVEGSVMAFNRWSITSLRFDENIRGFHGYDEIAMQARALGKRVVVADIDTCHHTRMGFKSPESEADWQADDRYYREKWRL
jgi:hypothetical protein